MYVAFVVNKKLDTQALFVFQGLRRFYRAVNVVSSWIGGLSFAALTFSKFHPTNSSRVFEGFLCSSAMAAIISVMLFTVLLFTFEGRETATHKNLV
jgi:hypothetical protein